MNNTFKIESKVLTVSVVDGTDHNLDAEAMAMLSALTSRSKDGPKANLNLVKEKGAQAFMDKFYIGYGHGSIGKCGTTNVFISGISMIAMNYLQSLNPLYIGQESSTRYIPFESEGVYLPKALKEIGEPIVNRLMDLYLKAQPRVKGYLERNIPQPEGVSYPQWDRTLNARVFDICRSLLPAGCKTVGVWNGTLENFKQILTIAQHSFNDEIVEVAKVIYKSLQERYPSSFPNINLSEEEVTWYKSLADLRGGEFPSTLNPLAVYHDEILSSNLGALLEGIPPRPKYAPLPDSLGMMGRYNFIFNIDFGGFRDINRHRKGNCVRGRLAMNGVFNEWYLSQMPDDLANLVLSTLELNRHDCDDYFDVYDLEYLVPMGVNVCTEVSYPIDNAVYVAELRSGPTVHPTVRLVAQQMGDTLERSIVGQKVNLYYNKSDIDTLDVRRADQDIIEK